MVTLSPEKAAQELLLEVWDVDDVDGIPLPISPVLVAQHLGVSVYDVSFKKEDISGMLVKQAGEDARIYLSRGHNDNRKRFTCAHEIGHYVKRAESDGDNWAFVDRRDSMSSRGIDPEEVFANQFAASLLMPAERVRREWKKTRSQPALAVRFGVSVEAMGHRLRNLRLS